MKIKYPQSSLCLIVSLFVLAIPPCEASDPFKPLSRKIDEETRLVVNGRIAVGEVASEEAVAVYERIVIDDVPISVPDQKELLQVISRESGSKPKGRRSTSISSSFIQMRFASGGKATILRVVGDGVWLNKRLVWVTNESNLALLIANFLESKGYQVERKRIYSRKPE